MVASVSLMFVSRSSLRSCRRASSASAGAATASTPSSEKLADSPNTTVSSVSAAAAAAAASADASISTWYASPPSARRIGSMVPGSRFGSMMRTFCSNATPVNIQIGRLSSLLAAVKSPIVVGSVASRSFSVISWSNCLAARERASKRLEPRLSSAALDATIAGGRSGLSRATGLRISRLCALSLCGWGVR